MEDPIKFDLWGYPLPEAREQVVRCMSEQYPNLSRAEILRDVRRAIADDAALPFAGPFGWAAIQDHRQEPRNMFRDSRVFQEGYGPEDEERMASCELHGIVYGGCLGCPICGGRNAP